MKRTKSIDKLDVLNGYHETTISENSDQYLGFKRKFTFITNISL